MATKKGGGVGNAAVSKRVRLNVHVNPEVHQRLALHALMSGKNPGELIEELVSTHLRAWRVQVNSHGGIDRPVPAIESSPVVLAASN